MNRPEASRPPAPTLWWLALALPPLLLRIAQVGPLGFTSGDLRGFASDLVVTLLAATLALPLARRGRWLAAALAGLFAVLAVGNDEHLRALGAQARPGQAGYLLDATFVAGSVLPLLGSARLWGCLGAVALVLWLAFRGGKRKSPRRPKGRPPATAMALAGGAAAAGVALALWPLDGDSARWRQANVFEGAVRDGLRSGVPPSTPGGAGPAATASPGDLDGTPLFSLGGAENVLLVILEGVSGGHLASLAEAQGHGDLPDLMPRLDAFARRHLAYSSFVAQQRQTNRGEYALLCGRLPSLAGGSPTMSEAAREARPLPCLPRALKDLGYRTVYLQAAPLAFMLKDQFMPLAGFDEAHGDEWFQNPHLHNQWGVDDRTFFEQSLGMVEQLRRNRADGGAPWFLTLLTVGTHHPFNAPEDFPSQHAPGTFPWAAEYLDHRVADFLDALEQAGVLDDTAVLLTSDESVGLARGQDDLERLMAQAWGFLVIAAPEGPEGQRIQQPFAQSDLPITILDLLGRDDAARAFGGRSALRRYAEPRTLSWGNVYLDHVGGLGPSGHVYGCRPGFDRCAKWSHPPDRLFSPERQVVREGTPGEIDFLKDAVAASRPGGQSTLERTYLLTSDERVAMVPVPDRQWIFAGQFLWAPPGSRMDVELAVTARGAEASPEDGPATVWLMHDLFADDGKLYGRGAELRDGETATYRYSLGAGDAGLDRVENRLWVMRYTGEGVALEIERATMTITPADGLDAPAPPGLGIDEFSITPAGG